MAAQRLLDYGPPPKPKRPPQSPALPEAARRHLAAARVSAELAAAGPVPQPSPGAVCVVCVCVGVAGRGGRAVHAAALPPGSLHPPRCLERGQLVPAAAEPPPRPGVTAPGAHWRLRPRRPRRAPRPPAAAVPRSCPARTGGALPLLLPGCEAPRGSKRPRNGCRG